MFMHIMLLLNVFLSQRPHFDSVHLQCSKPTDVFGIQCRRVSSVQPT